MSQYSSLKNKLVNGDSIDELKKLKDNSVDLLCTDPPYGYGFMGKSWDKMLPPKEIFEESLRVLKPGGFAFVMSAPRSDVQYRMMQMLDDVGFDVSFSPIYWTYATGFPKAMNIQKAAAKRGDIDKAKELDGSYAGYQPKPAVEVVIVAMKPLEKKGYLDQALDNGKGVTWLDDCRMPFAGMSDMNAGWWGITKEEQSEALSKYHIDHKGYDDRSYSGNRSKDYEQYLKDRKGFTERSSIEEGSVYAKEYGGTYNYGFKKPVSKDLEQYNKDNVGSQKNFDTDAEGLSRGNQPSRKSKSDYDKYVKKQKSFKEAGDGGFGGSENVYGDGNAKNPSKTYQKKTTKRKPREENTVFKTSGFKSEDNDTAEASPLGRFAANLLISDDILEKDFSRFYSLDAWWEDRVKKLPEEIQRTFPFLVVPKASKSEKNMGLDKLEKKLPDTNDFKNLPSARSNTINTSSGKPRNVLPSQNIHPTVKPLKLMSYLVTLGSRKGDVVLDPFMGSGTTPMACVTLSRNYIGIEREDEYFKIAQARVNKLENPIKQWEQWM